jgi:hypothetical protein
MRQWPSIDPLLSVRVGGGMIFQSSSEFRFTLSIVLLHLLFPSRKEETRRVRDLSAESFSRSSFGFLLHD